MKSICHCRGSTAIQTGTFAKSCLLRNLDTN